MNQALVQQQKQQHFAAYKKPLSIGQGSKVRGIIQAKLKIGAPNDKYEQEADRVAEQVMRMPESQLVSSENNSASQYGKIQRVCTSCPDDEKPIQMKKSDNIAPEVASIIDPGIQSLQGRGQPLAKLERTFFERRLGHDFSQVRIHHDTESTGIAESIRAQAFTTGNHIVLNINSLPSGELERRSLLAHELTHVVQQNHLKGRVSRKVDPKKVTCAGYASSHPTIKVIGTTNPLGVLERAHNNAIKFLNDVISELEYLRAKIAAGAEPAWPTVSDCVGLSLRTRFRMNPEKKSTWVGRGKTATLIRWYKQLRSVLQSNVMRYTCIDKYATDCKDGRDAASIPGSYRIYLCKKFWTSSAANQALTIIHETTHIYYNTDDHNGRTVMNAHCLEQFVAELNGTPIEYPAACGGINPSC